MSSDQSGDPRQIATEQLKSFGLSTYAAKTFLALLEVEIGTAKQISEISEVPRTRVYDAMGELETNGLVDVQPANPKRFRAVSAETAGKYFQQQFNERLDSYQEAVAAIKPTNRTEEQRGVWTVTGQDKITDRVTTFIDSATEELVFMSVEDLLTDKIVGCLRNAQNRDVSIRLGKMSEAAEKEIENVLPEATFLPSLWAWDDLPSGRVLMVDNKKTLVSVQTPTAEYGKQTSDETAIWGSGTNNNLVVVLQALFTWQLDSSRF